MSFPLQFLLQTVLPQLLMGKGNKKHSKKGKDELSENILDVAALSVKKFRKVTKEISKLSTGQKVVGGVALLAAGLTYLAARQAEPAAPARGKTLALSSGPDEPTSEDEPEEPADASGVPPKARKPRKGK